MKLSRIIVNVILFSLVLTTTSFASKQSINIADETLVRLSKSADIDELNSFIRETDLSKITSDGVDDALKESAMLGSYNIIKRLLDEEVIKEKATFYGPSWILLHWSNLDTYKEIIALLTNKKMLCGRIINSVLVWLSERNLIEKVRELINNPNTKDKILYIYLLACGPGILSALEKATKNGHIEVIIELITNPNTKGKVESEWDDEYNDDNGIEVTLITAIEWNKMEIFMKLITNPEYREKIRNWNELFNRAIQLRQQEMFQFLIKQPEITSWDEALESAMWGKLEIFMELVNNPESRRKITSCDEALNIGAKNKYIKKVEELLTNPNLKGKINPEKIYINSFLSFAEESGNFDFFKNFLLSNCENAPGKILIWAVNNNKIVLVREILANYQICDHDINRSFFIGAKNGNLEITQEFIIHPNIKNKIMCWDEVLENVVEHDNAKIFNLLLPHLPSQRIIKKNESLICLYEKDLRNFLGIKTKRKQSTLTLKLASHQIRHFIALLLEHKIFNEDLFRSLKSNDEIAKNVNWLIFWATKFGSYFIVRVLVTNPKLKKLITSNQWYRGYHGALIEAAKRGYTRIFQLLIEQGIITEEAVNCALAWACLNGHPMIVLDLGVHPKTRDKIKTGDEYSGVNSALAGASGGGYDEIVALLLHHSIFRKKITFGNPGSDVGIVGAIKIALRMGHIKVIRLFKNYNFLSMSRTFLGLLVLNNQEEIIELLVKAPKAIAEEIENIDEILLWAVDIRHPYITNMFMQNIEDVDRTLIYTIKKGRPGVAQALLENERTEKKITEEGAAEALMEAEARGFQKVVKLLSKKIDVMLENLITNFKLDI